MIDKQKQIEEMAKDYYGYSIDLEEDCKFVAAEMYDKGHRKISENTVVLTEREHEIAMKNQYDVGFKFGCKEMAKKFAERLKDKMDNQQYLLLPTATVKQIVDKICKEITEGNG